MTHAPPVTWFPFCGNTSCSCMEPNLRGPCDEHKEHPVNPRCAECGWPEHRHVEQDAPRPVAEVMRARLTELGVTVAEASRRLTYSPSHVNKMLHGKEPVSVGFAARFEQVFEIDTCRLLHRQLDEQFAAAKAKLGPLVPPRRKPSKADRRAERNAQILRDNAAGLSVVDISRKYHLSATYTSELLGRLRVPPAARVQVDKDAIFAASQQGITQREIAEQHGVAQTTISNIVRRKRAELAAPPREEPSP